MIQSGFEVISVDHKVGHPFAPIVSLDLTTDTGRQILLRLLQHPRLFAIHMGLPCGTASRAREKPIPQELQEQGVPSPPQLRSAENPLGMPGLSELNQKKVDSANALYSLAIDILVEVIPRGVVVSIENPWNSWMWSALVELARRKSPLACKLYNQLDFVQFHACCHGSLRRKNTGWLSTKGVFAALQAQCKNDHPHASWGVNWRDGKWTFDTASEAAYPVLLAQRAAACLAKEALHKELSLRQQPRLHDKATASTGQQSRKHFALIPEYHHVKTLPATQAIPQGAKIIAPHRMGEFREETKNKGESVDNRATENHRVGFFHTPEQFLSMAKTVAHPMDTADHIEPVTKEAINFNLKHHPDLVKIERRKNLLQARLMAKQLEAKEKELHSNLPGCLEKVLANKKLLLWKGLLEKYGYDDMGVCDLMFRGVPLVGQHDTPSCYPEKVKLATLTEDDLRKSAKWRRAAIIGRQCYQEDDHVAHLMQATTEEVDLGFLEGPFHTEEEVNGYFGHDNWAVIRRFVLVQGAEKKLRPIDDCLEAQLNFAYTSTSYLKLQDVDYIAGVALQLASLVSRGKPTFGKGSWTGKCLDLSKAYKQMGVVPNHRDLSVIYVRGPGNRPLFYVSNSLMFGATASVYAFNRASRSLWFLFNRMLHIPCGVFFDDFPMFSPAELSESADTSASELLDMLGWMHAKTGPKGKPFESSFDVLGCHLCLANLSKGIVTLENKQGRVTRLTERLGEIKELGQLNLHEAQILHGLMRYACGFFAGRRLQQVCSEIFALTKPGVVAGKREVVDFCCYALKALSTCKPRILEAAAVQSPIHVFTDGAWENRTASLGSVVVDTVDGSSQVLHGCLPGSLRDLWLKEVGEQLICQIELYAMVAIRWQLGEWLSGRRSIWWVDNEAARHCLIKGVSGSKSMQRLCRAFYDLEALHPTFSWFERVPSYSNPADAPSRFQVEGICKSLGLSHAVPISTDDYLVKQLIT